MTRLKNGLPVLDENDRFRLEETFRELFREQSWNATSELWFYVVLEFLDECGYTITESERKQNNVNLLNERKVIK